MVMKKIITITLNPAIDYTVAVSEFKTGSVNRALGSEKHAGGKGINVAAVTSLFRLETSVTGFLGAENKKIFHEHFEKYMIRDQFLYLDGSTREGIKIVDRASGETTDINFPGFEVTSELIENFKERFIQLISSFDYAVFSGSLPQNVPASIYADLCREAKKAGLFTALDTSGEAFVDAVESGYVDFVKPNEHEMTDVYGTVDAVSAGLSSKVNIVAVSMGAAGSRLYTPEGIFQATAPEVMAGSSVGAGDSFLGGFISALALNNDYASALRLAGATAAANLSNDGPGWSEQAPPGYFHDQIEISKM